MRMGRSTLDYFSALKPACDLGLLRPCEVMAQSVQVYGWGYPTTIGGTVLIIRGSTNICLRIDVRLSLRRDSGWKCERLILRRMDCRFKST